MPPWGNQTSQDAVMRRQTASSLKFDSLSPRQVARCIARKGVFVAINGFKVAMAIRRNQHCSAAA